MSKFRRRQMMSAAEVEPDYLTFTAQQNNSSIKLSRIGSPTIRDFEYRINKGQWIAYTLGDTINLDSSDIMNIRRSSNASTSLGQSNSNYYRFYMSGLISASGNIMSLFDKTCNLRRIGGFALRRLFYYCTSLTSAPVFGFDTMLDQAVCDSTFAGCTLLEEAPELLPTIPKNYCYYNMFAYSGVKYIKMHLKSTANSWSYSWLQNVPSNGTLICDPSLSLSSGVSGLPSTWTRLNLDGTPYVEP